MDADFSHDPREIPKFLARLGSCDMVIGSRYVPGGGTSEWGWARPFLWAGDSS
jgi:dolichol-phosphate mannosyltransferase